MEKKGKIPVTGIVIAGLVVVVVLMGVQILTTRSTPVPAEESPKQRSYLVTEDNVDEVVEAIQTPSPAPYTTSYTATMNSEWYFADGHSPSDNAYVENSVGNYWPVWFDVTLDSGETIYESPILPVNSHIRNFALDTPLEAGAYSAVVTYHLVDENQTELSSLSIAVSIQVFS